MKEPDVNVTQTCTKGSQVQVPMQWRHVKFGPSIPSETRSHLPPCHSFCRASSKQPWFFRQLLGLSELAGTLLVKSVTATAYNVLLAPPSPIPHKPPHSKSRGQICLDPKWAYPDGQRELKLPICQIVWRSARLQTESEAWKRGSCVLHLAGLEQKPTKNDKDTQFQCSAANRVIL